MLSPSQKAQIAGDIDALANRVERPKVYPKEGESKRCSTCRQWLALTDFDCNKRMRDGYQNVCTPCRREYHRRWYQKRKSGDDTEYLARQAANLRRTVLQRKLKKYGLTQEQYNQLVSKGCAICAGPPNGRGRYAFDHDHTTGKFRGLLCTKCNTGIGQFNDNQNLLIRAVGYLAAHVE